MTIIDRCSIAKTTGRCSLSDSDRDSLCSVSPLAHPRSRDHRHPVVVHESSNLCAALWKAYRKHLGSPRKIFSWLAYQIIRPVSMSTTSSPGSPVRPELPDSQKHWEEKNGKRLRRTESRLTYYKVTCRYASVTA